MSNLSAGLLNVQNLTVSGTSAGSIQAANMGVGNFDVSGDLTASNVIVGNASITSDLSVTGDVTLKTSTKNKLGATMSLTLNNVKNSADLLSIPAHCRSLGVTDIEIWHGVNNYYSFSANKARPTIAELTPFKNACDEAGVSIVSVIVDKTSADPTGTADSLLGSSIAANRDEVVSFVEDMAPVYKFLGCKMMRFTIDTDTELLDFATNPAHKATMFANILDCYTRMVPVAQGLILTAENHSNFTDPESLIELYNYITPTIPSFSYVVDTNNWVTDGSDKPTKTYALAPYAYQFSVKIAPFDEGYMRPDGTLIAEFTVDRKIAFSEKGFTDLNYLMDIFEASSNVPVRSKSPLMIENERNINVGLNKVFIDTKRIFLQVLQRYPRFMSTESSMLSGGMMGEIDKDLNYYNQNLKSVIEQSQRNEEIVTQERMENWQERTYNKIGRGKKYHYIVVGAGSAGASAAQALASFTRGEGKFVLLIERGPSRPLSYVGGYNFYSNFIQPGADKLNSVFGQYYIKEEGKLKPSLVERLLSCTAGMPVDASGVSIGTNTITGCNDPFVLGGGSTYNGSNTHYASDWYNERNAHRGGGIIDLDVLNQCGEYISDVVGNREDDFFTLAQNDTVSRVFTKLETDSCYPWIGTATGELKKEMLPSKIIKNLAFSSAETGGIRWGMQVLRTRSTGYPRRNASASLVEQFDNNYFNLDVLCNAKCNKILFEKYDASGNSYMRGGSGTPGQYVRDSSGAAVAYGIEVTYDDKVDETFDPSMDIFLKDTGEIFVAGNVYNSPVILERSGIGRQTLIESCGLEFISENLEIGENLHNNYITGGVCGGVAVAVPYGTVTEINDTAYKSNKDVRRTLVDNKFSTFSLAHHDDSDRSRVRGNVDISVPSAETSIIVLTPGGLDSEVSGAITFGTVHIDPSGTDITVPKVNFDWFNSNSQDGRRNLDGAVRAVKKIYNQLTSATAAYYCLGSGFDSSGNAIERDPDCAEQSPLYTDAVDGEGDLKDGWFKSNAGGVYNKGYDGKNLDTATYDELKRTVTTVGIREAIHWNGTVAYGKATDKNFIVKGTQNVRCCCSAVMNEPYPQNNWAMVTQWARYIAMNALGLTAPYTPTDNFTNKIAEYIDTSGSPVPIALDTSGTEIIVTAYDSDTYELTYHIKKGATVLPDIVTKFSGATINSDETASLYNFRSINEAKNAYDIPVTGGLYDAYDCGIMQSKIQFELFGQTTLGSKIYIYEITREYIQDLNTFALTSYVPSLRQLYVDSSGGTHFTDPEYLDQFAGYPLTKDIYAEGSVPFNGILTVPFLLNYNGGRGYSGDIVRVELCTHRWTTAGLDWAYTAIFKDDNKGGRINPFENKPTRVNDPVYSSSYEIMTAIDPTFDQAFLIAEGYITVNLWYQLSLDEGYGIVGKIFGPDELDLLDLKLNHLRISMAAYDEDDKFVDDIGDVPIKPGTHRFVAPA